MANFLLSQTGEEVQEILNQAPQTQADLQAEVTNREQAIADEQQAREQAIADEQQAREQADSDEVTARNEAIAQALATALADYYTQQEVDGLMSDEVAARNQAIATAIAQTIADYYTKAQIDTTLEDYATIAGVAATLADYYTKTQVDASLADIQAQVTALINGTTPSKLADNLTSWDERGETPSSEEWSDVVRTTGGDMSIDSSRGAKLLSIVPLQPFYADTLKATGFNLLHDAVAVGSGYYFEVPALTYGLINTAEQNNGLLFTARNGDNLRPVVYFKPLSQGVPAHANDGEVCAYTDAGGYRFYTCNEPGYIIVSNITLEDTCAHIAWSRRYGEFIAPDAQSDAGSSIDLATLIHTVHSYDLLLRAARGEEIVYDEIRFVSGNANWYRRVDRVQPEWTTTDNGDETYTHTATIAQIKQNGVAQCGQLALTVNGTTVSYTDSSAEATTDYVLYQLATAANGSVEMSNDYAVEDWGLEILTDVTGTADLTTQYYQALPDAVAALLTKVPALRTALTQEAETRVQNEKQIRLDIEAEENRAKQAEQTLQQNINSEAQTRQQNDQTLQGNINSEAQTRQQADQTLQGNIDAEKTRAEGAEGTLQGNIDAEAQARQDADAAINAKIPQAASSNNLLVDRQYLAEQIALEVQARQGADADLQTLIDAILAKIPSAATAQNQLADKAFVNSSSASNTGSLITDNGQPWSSLADLEAYSGTLNNNDYAFVVTTDGGNTIYNRYKYNASTQQWAFEYALNNSSFTAAQFAALNSGITDLLVAKLSGLPNATELATQISTAITTALASYYTKSEIDTRIAGYYTKTQIDTLIADYSTTTQMNTAISTAIATALADYYTKTQIDTLIADYSTTAQMTAAITNALADYYTKTQIDTLIADYSTTQQMTTAISNAITTALASYSTTQDMNTAIATALSSYYTKTEIDNLLTGYATSGALSTHTNNTTVHITAAERTAWNAKQNAITDGVQIGGGLGVCTTDATTAAKVATLANFLMLMNMPVSIHFTKAINCTGATLNINSQGAKPLYIGGNALQPGVVKAGCTITVVYDGTNWNIICISGLEQSSSPSDLFVDMGLPSGLLWAKKNIDVTQADGFAASEYQYECTFFSWGNTQGHNPSSSSAFSYDWGSSNDGPYASTPGAALNGNVPASMDFARANLGAPWRLPTTDEFAELFNSAYTKYIDADGNDIAAETTNKLTTMSGITGIRLKSKVNNNILFFPCSGYGNGSTWNSRGSGGYYWSGSLYSAALGRNLDFYSGGVNPQYDSNRFFGFSGRAVQ